MSALRSVTTLIFPPAGSGSKGDEAMIRGALRLFSTEDVVVINPEQRSWTGELDDICDFREIYYEPNEFPRLVDNRTVAVFVGADVIDGSAGIQGSLMRLEAMETALKAGAIVYVFFSYRSDVDREIVSRLNALAEFPSIRFFLRDERSLERFREAYPSSDCNFLPDLAFYAYDLNGIEFKKNKEFEVLSIGVNFSEQSFRATRVDISDDNRRSYIRDYLTVIVDLFPRCDLSIISNDIRMWDGFWSDFDYSLACKNILDDIGFKGNLRVVNPVATYREIIDELRNMDIIVAGRMHLAIASFLAGVLPVVVTGKSFVSKVDLKQRGMFDKARGMLDWCFGRPDCVVTESDGLRHLLVDVVNENEKWRELIKDRRSALNNNLSACVACFKEFDKRFFVGAQTKSAINESVVSALKLERFKLEVECRDHLKELAVRGVWAKHLQNELIQAEEKIASLSKALAGLDVAAQATQEIKF